MAKPQLRNIARLGIPLAMLPGLAGLAFLALSILHPARAVFSAPERGFGAIMALTLLFWPLQHWLEKKRTGLEANPSYPPVLGETLDLQFAAARYRDVVTGLPNRTTLIALLEEALGNASGQSFEASILFIDLDNFKHISGTLGYDAGDEVLDITAHRLVSNVFGLQAPTSREYIDQSGGLVRFVPDDVVVGRFSEDEFVIILPNVTSLTELGHLCHDINLVLGAPAVISDIEVKLGVSIGVARCPLDSSNALELINFADFARTRAKAEGEGLAVYEDRLKEQAERDIRIEAEIRAAIENDDFEVFYQPKVFAKDNCLAGVEALVRMCGPEGEIINPGYFIEVAERRGLISGIGQIVLRKAIADCRSWLEAGYVIPVAINASAMQFAEETFVDEVLAAVECAGLPAGLIEIEVTESAAMGDVGNSRLLLERLSQGGIHLAIDDFGTGYSNMSQLAKLPFSTLKIDRSLISPLGQDFRGDALLIGVLGMASALGLVTVAEGVETEEQYEFLRRHPCDIVQGFYVAKPMPADELMRWYQSRNLGVRASAA